MTISAPGPGDKKVWRARLLAARSAVPAEVRAAEAAALAEAVSTLITGRAAGTACGYLPVGTEPGSADLLDRLRLAGWRVLLPIVADPGAAAAERGALDWAEFTGPDTLVPGPFGLREPGGPRLGPAAIGSAAVLLIPALGVDRRGVRLGRGAGHYDRSLPLADPAARRIAVVRDDELVAELPAEPHDVRMTAALTPGRGLLDLG